MDQNLLKDIKNKVALSDIVGHKVRLKQSGSRFLGLCPFHGEKTPSFIVNNAERFYHCFGCGAHGDAFDFVMKTDNVDLVAAIRSVAGHAGILIPEALSVDKREETKITHSIGLFNQRAAQWFHNRLKAERRVLEYLAGRDILPEDADKFLLGYAPLDCGQLIYELSREFPDEIIARSGLVYSDMSCKFKGRIVFPIANAAGTILGFGGRILDSAAGIRNAPKYLNSSESELFKKGRALYGINLAKSHAQKTNQIIIVEGYTDTIAMHRHGFINTAGCMGTALSGSMVQEAWSMSGSMEIVLIMDSDKAGQAAAERIALEVALPLIGLGKTIKVVSLAQYKDPAELLSREGPAAMRVLIDSAMPLEQFIYQVLSARHMRDAAVTGQRALFQSELKKTLSAIKDNSLRFEISREINSLLFREFVRAKKSTNQDTDNVAHKIIGPREPYREMLHSILRKYPGILDDPRIEESLPAFYADLGVCNAGFALEDDIEIALGCASAIQKWLDRSPLKRGAALRRSVDNETSYQNTIACLNAIMVIEMGKQLLDELLKAYRSRGAFEEEKAAVIWKKYRGLRDDIEAARDLLGEIAAQME